MPRSVQRFIMRPEFRWRLGAKAGSERQQTKLSRKRVVLNTNQSLAIIDSVSLALKPRERLMTLSSYPLTERDTISAAVLLHATPAHHGVSAFHLHSHFSEDIRWSECLCLSIMAVPSWTRSRSKLSGPRPWSRSAGSKSRRKAGVSLMSSFGSCTREGTKVRRGHGSRGV